MDPTDPAYAGQKDYTPALLGNYDGFVIGFMAPRVWKCPAPPVIERYRQYMGHRHLDVGPGTGYFIENAHPGPDQEVTLLDPNPNVLEHASRRITSGMVTTVEADVLKPLPVEGPFDSAALSFVLHCLPGPQPRKAAAIRNIAAVLAPDGVLFGATVLGKDERHTRPARVVLSIFNRQGGFDNATDTVEGLREILEESFAEVVVDVVGSTAHFVARHPRHSG
jgi:ubiquinone/menaquinone biosynthesis C-methylase UbiE